MKETLKVHSLLFLMLVIHGLTVSPLTSISHAPQLPVRHPVGISKPAFLAIRNQSLSSYAYVFMLLGHKILNLVFFNLEAKKYVSVFRIHMQDY